MKKRVFRKLYQNFFYIPERTKVPDKVFHFRTVFSVVSIIACMAVMMSSAFALFCSEVSSKNSTLTGANYYITVSGAEEGTYVCPPVFDDEHIFEITARGTATTGFCVVQIGDETYYTNQIPQGESVILTVIAAEGTVIKFTSKMGKLVNYGIDSTCGYIIEHSHTPMPLEEKEGEVSQTEENTEIQSESLSEVSNETEISSNEAETSSNLTESSDSDENSKDITDDSPVESSAESVSTPEQTSGESGASSSDGGEAPASAEGSAE